MAENERIYVFSNFTQKSAAKIHLLKFVRLKICGKKSFLIEVLIFLKANATRKAKLISNERALVDE